VSFEQLVSLEISNILAVLGIAASPISELRGAIPIAIGTFHFPWYYAFIIAIIGNLMPVPFILLLLNFVSKLLCKISVFKKLLNWLFERIRRRGKAIERYEHVGLALFVAIPLPITGAWTGSIIAVLLGLKFRYAFLSIFIGIIISGVIVTCATVLGWAVADILTTPAK